MQYVEQLQSMLCDMEEEKRRLDKEILTLPDGRLRVHRRGHGLAYFMIDNNGKEHGVGRHHELIDELARKELLTAKSQALAGDIAMCGEMIGKMKLSDDASMIKNLKHGLSRLGTQQFYQRKPSGILVPKPVNDLALPLRPLMTKVSDLSPEEWAVAPYQENTKHYDEKRHLGTNGLYFRSRAEMLVAAVYEKNNWNYHYDERMVTEGGDWISPDFIHCNPDNELMYHEHCEFDRDDYDANFSRKLGIYFSSGIKPGKNLIITWGNKDGSLNLQQIERILMNYHR